MYSVLHVHPAIHRIHRHTWRSDDLQDNDRYRYQVPTKKIMIIFIMIIFIMIIFIMIIFIMIISIIIMKFYARENELILMEQLKNSSTIVSCHHRTKAGRENRARQGVLPG